MADKFGYRSIIRGIYLGGDGYSDVESQMVHSEETARFPTPTARASNSKRNSRT